MVYFFLRNELKPGTYSRGGSFLSAISTIDAIGTLLFIISIGLIILGTAWGGSSYPWASAQVLVPLIIGGICFVLFFVYEYLLGQGKLGLLSKQRPMLPYSMFQKLDILWLAILQFATGAAMYSAFYYIGIYFTVVEGYPAGEAGVQLLYYIPGLGGTPLILVENANKVNSRCYNCRPPLHHQTSPDLPPSNPRHDI